MTCCTKTAYIYRKHILPYADQHLLNKNKICDAHNIFKSDHCWIWAHMHIALQVEQGYKVHDVIINRNHDEFDLCDSFIEHRDVSKRSYKSLFLYKLWSTFSNLSETIEARKLCYNIMFDSPLSYTDNWNGTFECWLIRLI